MLQRILITALVGLLAFLGWDYTRSARTAPTAPAASQAKAADGVTPLATRSLSEGLPTRGQWRGHPVLADLDGDGKLDLVASVRRYDRGEPGDGIWVWRGDGKGQWRPMLQGLSRNLGYGGAEVGDINKDGKLDIAFSGHDLPPHVFINGLTTGGGGFWAGSTDGIDCEVMCLDVALGDCDGDGNLDLACVGLMPKVGGLYLYRGDGHGGFGPMAELLPRTNYGADVRIIDIDGDGRGEILAATDTGCRVWRYDATNGCVDIGQGLPKPVIGGVELGLLAVELDGSPGLELVAIGLGYLDYPSVRIYHREGSEWKTWCKGLPDDLPWYDVATLRVAGDPRPRIVLAGKQGIMVLEVAPDGVSRTVGHLTGTSEVLNITTGDIDGDGNDEVAYVGFTGVVVVQVPELTKHEEKIR